MKKQAGMGKHDNVEVTNECVYLTFKSEHGCTIDLNLRIYGKYKQSFMLSEIP